MLHLSALFVLAGLFQLAPQANAGPVPAPLAARSNSRVMKMPLTKRVSKRAPVKRDGYGYVVADLGISEDATSYDIIAYVGSPAQEVVLQLDTGSSDLWVLAPGACDTGSCTCPAEGCTYFDPNASSSAELLDGEDIEFDGSYGSGQVEGVYITDDVYVGSASLTDVIIAVVDADKTEPRGIMGVGLPQGEADNIPTHPGIIGELYSQGWIESQSFSLYLGEYSSGTGEVIFGGADSSLYTGDLVTVPIVPSPDGVARYTVEWSSLNIYVNGDIAYESSSSGSSLNNGPATLIDSGTTLARIAQDVFDEMVTLFSLTQDSTGVWFADCGLASADVQLVFGFGAGPDVSIVVPASEILRPSAGTNCVFGFQPNSDPTAASSPHILGDVFLTSAYVDFDIDSSTLSFAQAAWVSA